MRHIFFTLIIFIFNSLLSCGTLENSPVGEYQNRENKELRIYLREDKTYIFKTPNNQVSGEWKKRKSKIVFIPWTEIDGYEVLEEDYSVASITYRKGKLTFNVDDNSKDFLKIGSKK